MQDSVKIEIDELSYYAESFRKINHKKYEFFVISRIFHLLNDLEIEFVTQQVVGTAKGRFLLDLYFPQFQIAVEIDEDYHSKKNQIQKDQLRERAIVDASRIKTIRINIKDKTITEIFLEIQQVVDFILAEKEKRIKTG